MATTTVIILLGRHRRRANALTQIPTVVHRHHITHIPQPTIEVPQHGAAAAAAAGLLAVVRATIVLAGVRVGAVDVVAAGRGDC